MYLLNSTGNDDQMIKYNFVLKCKFFWQVLKKKKLWVPAETDILPVQQNIHLEKPVIYTSLSSIYSKFTIIFYILYNFTLLACKSLVH